MALTDTITIRRLKLFWEKAKEYLNNSIESKADKSDLLRPKLNLTDLFEGESGSSQVEGEEAFRKILMIGPDVDIKTYLKELVKHDAVDGLSDAEEPGASYPMVLALQQITDYSAVICYNSVLESGSMMLMLAWNSEEDLYQAVLSTIAFADQQSLQSLEQQLYNNDPEEGTLGDIVKLTEGLEEAKSDIEEIRMFKYPNATIKGELTVNNGQVSGFTRENYMVLPFSWDTTNKRFSLRMAFITGDDVTTPQNIIGSAFVIAMYIEQGKLNFRVSSNGSSWNIISSTYDRVLSANHPYYVTMSHDGLNYKVQFSEDGKTWVDVLNIGSNQFIHSGLVYLGIGNNFNNPFKGVINLNGWELLINGEHYWQGMDDAGLSTRLATDLSNLDADGREVIEGIAKDNAVTFEEDGSAEVVPMPFVEYVEQSLTEEQKAQARKNIGVGKWGVISQKQTWASDYISYTMTDLVYGEIPQANIDLFTSKGAIFNEQSGYFELNGLRDISYEEMLRIYNVTNNALSNRYPNLFLFDDSITRTCIAWNVQTKSSSLNNYAGWHNDGSFYGSGLESFVGGTHERGLLITEDTYFLAYCKRLKSAKYVYKNGAWGGSAFSSSYNLETLFVSRLNGNIALSRCSKLTVESVLYMINNSLASPNLTITLHADAYARAMADEQVQQALQSHPNVSLASA